MVGDTRFSMSALVQQATESPAGFSPNVLLRPVVPDSVMVMFVHCPIGSGSGALSACSAPLLLTVIAKRGRLVPPALTVRNM